MKNYVLLLMVSSWVVCMHAEQQEAFPLWPNGAPGAFGQAEADIPTLTPFLPEASAASGAALVICPGGGYGGLAQHEGRDYAIFFNEHGVAGFVLKYRLGSHGYHHPRMLEDAARALRYVRANAAKWHVDPKRIGIVGSSAGGHLASTLLTHFDAGKADADDPVERVSSRPDLGILCYPVITMGPFTHAGSRNNLLGTNATPQLVWELSNELQVTPATPPVFIWHTQEDTVVPVENSFQFAQALRKAGVPFDFHVYERGRHGIGLANGHPWTHDCLFWLKEHQFLK